MKINLFVSNEDQAMLVSSMFKSLPDSPFNDVTLVCSDGQLKVNGLTLALLLPNPYRSLPFGEGALLLLPDHKVQEVWKMLEDGGQDQGNMQEYKMKQEQEVYRKQEHDQEKLQIYQCDLCYHVFKNKIALKKHEDTKHRNLIEDDDAKKDSFEDKDKTIFYCSQCNKYFCSKTILKKHKTTEHESHDSLSTKAFEVSERECNSENKLENQIYPNQGGPEKVNNLLVIQNPNVTNQPNKVIEPSFALEDSSDEVEESERKSLHSLQSWAGPDPPSAKLFPAFTKGPLSVLAKKARDVTWMLRRVLHIFHPRSSGPFGRGRNPWWDEPVSCSLLTSPTSLALVSGMEMFSPGDFLPWSAMYLPSRFHSGPRADSGVFRRPCKWNYFKILLLEHCCILAGVDCQQDGRGEDGQLLREWWKVQTQIM